MVLRVEQNVNDNVSFASNVPLNKQEKRQLRDQARLFGNVQFIANSS
jgi:hypothetical protein